MNQLPNLMDSIWKTSPTSTSNLKLVSSRMARRSALLTVEHSSMTSKSYSPLGVYLWLATVRNVAFGAVTRRRRFSTAGWVWARNNFELPAK